MRFGILGPLTAWRQGEEVDIGGPRVRLLLALLLLEAGRVVPTSRLVDGLWGEHRPKGAANALQSLISRLRSALDPDVAIESRSGGYMLPISPDAVDAQRFARLAEDGRRAIAGGDPATGASLLREALALWRGAPLADLDGSGVEAARARLERLRLAVSEDRIEAELATGDQAHLIPELATLSAGHPLNERLRGLYMRALHGAGRQAEALTVFEETRRMLGEELGADPSDELQRLHVAILRRDPALERKDRPPTNLRAQLTSFVGRKDDLHRVGDLLQSARLVTLVGAGGAGKTRLAMELAARLVESMPDGVWVVELAPLSDAAAVVQAVLSVLGVREAALVAEHRAGVATEPVPRLIGALATRRLLLVLDNCEHLVHAVAGLAETLLARCPGLRILTTSREPLAVTGETLWQVPPLGLPPADAALGSVSEWDSVRLLLDRATAVNPGFTVDTGNLAAIIQVCRRLDGMPLAIELAAARLRSLTIEQIAYRLDDRFELLTGGSRTALPRHQTLRAVVDWSWDLLDPAERVLLRRLSVFAGGASLETVEAVCADHEIDPRRVLDLLTGLVDKSLVEVAAHRGGMRFRLLETVRAYAAERLGEAGESSATRAAHAGFFCDLAERADPELRGHDQLEWLRRLDDEHDNVRAALAWALEARDATLALRLTVAMWTDWSFRGSRAESRHTVTAAVELPGDADPWLRASGLVMHALHVFEMGQVDAATDEIEQARSLYSRSGRPPHPIFVTLAPMLALLRGDVDSARAMVRQVAIGRSDWTGAMGWLMAGYIASAHGGTDEAEDAFDRAAARFRAVGDRWGLSQALTGLSSVAEARGELDRQARALREALQQVELLGAREDLSRLLITLGSLEAMRGDREQGLAQVDEGMRVARELGSADALANGHFWKGSLARRLGNLTEARHQFERGLAIFGDENRMHPLRAMALVGLGFVAEQAGDLAAARARHLEAAGQILAGPFMPIWTAVMLANVVDGLAGVAAAGGDPEEAVLLVGAANGMRTIELRGDARWDVDRITESARRVLGEERFAKAHQRGAAMTYEEIVARITT